MTNPTDKLLADILDFCRRSGTTPKTFGQKAVGNWRLVQRLQEGGSVTLKTAQRVRQYLATERTDAAA